MLTSSSQRSASSSCCLFFFESGRAAWFGRADEESCHRLSHVSGSELEVAREAVELVCGGGDISSFSGGFLRCHSFQARSGKLWQFWQRW
jgi:hypothetical protein